MDMGLPKGLERPLATPRPIDAAERERFEGCLSEILRALGMGLADQATRGTPARLLQAWIDAASHALHSSTRTRGVCESDARTNTLAWRGDDESDESLRCDSLALLGPR